MTKTKKFAFGAVCLLAGSGLVLSWAQEPDELEVNHADCVLFSTKGRELSESGLNAESRRRFRLSQLTEEVLAASATKNLKREVIPGGSRTNIFQELDKMGTIDSHLFRAMQDAGATPSAKTDDYTFARRVSLDLTGRVPTYERLVQFINNPSPDKRARYIDELLETQPWVDKWAMFFGDLYKNVANNTQVNKYNEGRNAFHFYIRDSLAVNKPYHVMVSEMISAAGDHNWERGELNWMVNGQTTGGPVQDHYDQRAAFAAEMFLGNAHFNCILCHDGRRRMDPLSLWGKSETRLESWQMAAFFGRSTAQRVAVSQTPNLGYYRIVNNNNADYPLNTTTGNRSPRQPIGNIRNVAPEYPFADGGRPNPGEPYRVALARFLTNDFQFARATVNYFWKAFFGRGLVDPVNQFDPDRLDPDNPPPEPWTLQASHPRLLNELARDFINSGYDLKALMRQITNSEGYQLSSAYDGQWKAEWQNLYARKMVRRLWAEEIFDAIVQTSNVRNSFTVPGMDPLSWTMQAPDSRTPGGNLGSFLDSFLRGNRVDTERRTDGSVPQVLNLMNDTLVHTRTRASGAGNTASLARQLLNKYTAANNEALVEEAFLTVLSRPVTADEKRPALEKLNAATATATRQQRVEDLVWVLFNKVDFIYVL